MPPPKGRRRIGNGVKIPDRTAAVMSSDARYAIGSIPRRPRDAMRLSQKTCLRSAYRIFGLKRDMFLKRARLRGCPWAGCACDTESVAGYIGAGRCIPRFYLFLRGKTFVFPVIGALAPSAPASAGTRRQRGVVPGSRRGVPSPMAADRRVLPPWTPVRLRLRREPGLNGTVPQNHIRQAGG